MSGGVIGCGRVEEEWQCMWRGGVEGSVGGAEQNRLEL